MNCTQCEENEETDGIEPECETCQVPKLAPENQEILELYQLFNTAFVKDFSAFPLVLEVYGLRCTRTRAREILGGLIMIHEITVSHAKGSGSDG